MSNKLAPSKTSIVTRDVRKIEDKTGNLYESLAVIAKRANQIAANMKVEMTSKLSEFNHGDAIEEMTENREQIEIAVQYEKMPKPTLQATEEFLDNKTFFRNPAK